jgi:hypothetical protein
MQGLSLATVQDVYFVVQIYLRTYILNDIMH